MSPGADFKRRASDAHEHEATEEEILSLIRRAKDDDQKAHLIVLYKLATVITSVVTRLEAQESVAETHKQIVAKVSGAWRTMALVLGAFVALFGICGSLIAYIWLVTVDDIRRVSHENTEQAALLTELKQNPPISRESDKRLTVIENNLRDTIGGQIDLRQRVSELERTTSRVLEMRARQR